MTIRTDFIKTFIFFKEYQAPYSLRTNNNNGSAKENFYSNVKDRVQQPEKDLAEIKSELNKYEDRIMRDQVKRKMEREKENNVSRHVNQINRNLEEEEEEFNGKESKQFINKFKRVIYFNDLRYRGYI